MKLKRKSILTLVMVFFLLVFVCNNVSAKNGKISELQGKSVTYTAKQGEDLYPIAKKHGLAIEHVMFANGLKGIKTYPGQKLLIPLRRILPSDRLTNGIVLNLPERGMYLFEKGKLKAFYPVAIGAVGKWMTPTGNYKIITKVKDPVWLPPEWAKEEEAVPAGPNNPLGDRWMGLNAPGYGIHATNRPVSIGLATSHGCIRMYPESVHKLFDQVSVGTPVKIIYEPVKLGYDPEEKNFYLEVYPDVYGRTTGLMNYTKNLLQENNLLGLIGERELKEIVSKPKGTPIKILASDIVVKVNNQKQKLAFAPFMKDGKIWTTSEVLKPIGAVLQWNNEDKAVDIYRGKKKVSLKVVKTVDSDHPGDAPVSFLWNGRTIIPLSYVLKKLDVNYLWEGKDRTLLVYSGEISSKGNVKKTLNKPENVSTPTPKPKKYFVKPTPKPIKKVTPTPSPSPSPVPLPSPVPDEIPPQIGEPDENPSPSPIPPEVSPTEEPKPEPSEKPEEDPGANKKPAEKPKPDPGEKPQPSPTPEPEPSPSPDPDEGSDVLILE